MQLLPNSKRYETLKKIDTYNLIASTGCPVLSSVLIEKTCDLTPNNIKVIKDYLASDICTVRYQYTKSNKSPIVGGNLVNIDCLSLSKLELTDAKLWLLQKVTREKNMYGISIYFQENQIQVELVGKGFDGSDLNRGNVSPHEIITLENPIRMGWQQEWWKFIKVWICSHKQFLKSKNVRMNKLSSMGIQANDALFDERYVPLPYNYLEQLILYIKALNNVVSVNSVVAASILENGDFVFWDIHEEKDKINCYLERK